MTAIAVAILLGLAALTPRAEAAETRYSVAKGCFVLTSASSGQAVPLTGQSRMQPTRLGSYLLFGPAQDYLAAGPGNTVTRAVQPSQASNWEIGDVGNGTFTLAPHSNFNRVLSFSGGTLTTVPKASAGAATQFNFTPDQGCAVFPEAELGVSGTPAKGETSYGETQGFMDGHMHWMTYEYFGKNFHCGRPWHPFGIPSALPDCASIEGPLGASAPFQNFLNYGNPVSPHPTAGWPTLDSFSRTNLTYEGTYYRWLERVWASGMRLMVMPINENRALCLLQPTRMTNCNEMETVFRALDDVQALQDYVDAQAGGPGKGWFQIVKNPFEARKVINEGKLAIVEEVEISEPFDCMGTGPSNSTCDQAQVDTGLDALHARGVRSMLLLNKFDNPLTGVRFDGGAIAPIINGGNVISSGSFWNAETCKGLHDNDISGGGAPSNPFVQQTLTALGVPPGTVPAYPPAPNCNTRGLTDLGAHTVRKMMNMKMIVNPDHMSQRAVDKTLSLAEERSYSGVISPHGWVDPGNWPRIFNLGGMAFPDSNATETFVKDWRDNRPSSTPFYFGWGFGADLGGLAEQPESLPVGSPDSVTYPFKSLDGSVTIDRERTGQRVFDYPTEGVAHYGLYAEWIEEVRKHGGPQLANDMMRGSEAYLQMWERAEGVKPAPCKPEKAKFSKTGFADIGLGADSDSLLRQSGQPLRRTRAWTYCIAGASNAGKATTAVLTPEGKVAMIASTAKGHRSRKIHPGTKVKKLKRLAKRGASPAKGGKKGKKSAKGKSRGKGKAKGRRPQVKRLSKGLWVGRLGKGKNKTRVAYVVKKKRVTLVAVVGPEAKSKANLKTYLALVPEGTGAAPRAKDLEDKLAEPLTDATAVPLRMQRNRALSLVCGINF